MKLRAHPILVYNIYSNSLPVAHGFHSPTKIYQALDLPFTTRWNSDKVPLFTEPKSFPLAPKAVMEMV